MTQELDSKNVPAGQLVGQSLPQSQIAETQGIEVYKKGINKKIIVKRTKERNTSLGNLFTKSTRNIIIGQNWLVFKFGHM